MFTTKKQCVECGADFARPCFNTPRQKAVISSHIFAHFGITIKGPLYAVFRKTAFRHLFAHFRKIK